MFNLPSHTILPYFLFYFSRDGSGSISFFSVRKRSHFSQYRAEAVFEEIKKKRFSKRSIKKSGFRKKSTEQKRGSAGAGSRRAEIISRSTLTQKPAHGRLRNGRTADGREDGWSAQRSVPPWSAYSCARVSLPASIVRPWLPIALALFPLPPLLAVGLAGGYVRGSRMET